VPAVSPSFRRVRNWRQLDVEEFTADLVQTELIVSPPDDLVSGYECYESTLRALLDKHVPLQSKRVRTQASARWYDSECREVKRTTRRLERRYRRLRSTHPGLDDGLAPTDLCSTLTLPDKVPSRFGVRRSMLVRTALVICGVL